MIQYIRMNPQRLATKRLKPGYFRVQKEIEIGDRKYDGVGNVALLLAERFATIHVRSTMVRTAEDGDDTPLRNYMNNCVLMARKGVVMVSPFISPQERKVMQVLLQEQHPFILLADNGFRDYYKPADTLFDACSAGRLLILSPWPHDNGKRHINCTILSCSSTPYNSLTQATTDAVIFSCNVIFLIYIFPRTKIVNYWENSKKSNILLS
ncbi:MAG: hypothetical protein K6E45_03755 [Bacteroidaceae bacterium]|nr:hypothetical protein [Bacteroidaceae bacterium]